MFCIKRSAQSVGKRLIHTAPKLALQDEFAINGIPGLFSKKAFNTAWVEYQDFLTKRLTLLTNGTADETRHPFHIAINSARDQTQQKVFNVASQTHNNHFFFEQLIAPKLNTTKPSRDLQSRIDEKFESLEGLKEALVEESQIIIGQGWIFLVETEAKTLEILTVNNSGTPYNFSGNLSLDLNGPIGRDEFDAWDAIKEHTLTKTKDWTMPLLSINLWDHAYLHDYGIGNRDAYIRDVFDSINWNVINKRLYVS